MTKEEILQQMANDHKDIRPNALIFEAMGLYAQQQTEELRKSIRPDPFLYPIDTQKLKELVWKLDREVWAKVEAKEATTSWGREHTSELICQYFGCSVNEIEQLRKEAELLKLESDNAFKKVNELRKEVEELKEEIGRLNAELMDDDPAHTMNEVTQRSATDWKRMHDRQYEICKDQQTEITRLRELLEKCRDIFDRETRVVPSWENRKQLLADIEKLNPKP